jgi:transketolase
MESLCSTVCMRDTARSIRRRIIETAWRSQCPHVACALSCVDILTALYFDAMRLAPWDQRDICILSKGHASLALCCTLAERGILDEKLLEGYFTDRGTLPAHLDRFCGRGIEASTGALGHGFNIGLGLAYGFRKKGLPRRVFVVIGDGESQEGSIWEGACFAPRLGVDNFTAILDYNNLQGYGKTREVCAFEPVVDKWRAFGWRVVEVDGHDAEAMASAMREPGCGKPTILIAHTVKGKGVSFMENKLVWHYYMVSDQHRAQAMEELA